jgi:hypothetical protein
MSAVNYDLMYQATVRDAKGGSNQVVYWSRLLNWKNQTLTPNPAVIYLMPFINTAVRAGDSLQGVLRDGTLNCWRRG